tara:strand:- start:1352 stop:1804 length:453 start_codon:yes stop_codon:yes gene_type:complete
MDVVFVPTDPTHIRYMPDHAVPRMCEDTRGITALDVKKGPLGISLMDSWSENSVQIHMWIGNPLIIRYGFLQEVFGFVFSEESGRTIAMGMMPSDNRKVLNFSAHIGMEEVCRVPDIYADGIDSVISVMKKENCRWIENGKLFRKERRRA